MLSKQVCLLTATLRSLTPSEASPAAVAGVVVVQRHKMFRVGGGETNRRLLSTQFQCSRRLCGRPCANVSDQCMSHVKAQLTARLAVGRAGRVPNFGAPSRNQPIGLSH